MTNRIEINLTHRQNRTWHAAAGHADRAAAKARGIDWRDADVLVTLPERGRCFTKQPGFITLGAHG